MSNSSLLEQKLINGENVECTKCHEGIYKPFNPEYKINHVFRCDKCGDVITLEPNVVIE